jgi:hypothetical protein
MRAGSRCTKPITPVVMCAIVALFFAMVLPAAASAALTITPPNPVAGDTVTVQGSPRECESNNAPSYTFTIKRDSDGTTVASGPGTSGSSGVEYSATLSAPGTYTATEDGKCPLNMSYPVDAYTTGDFTVGQALGGSISSSPDPPVAGQQASLNVAPSGGISGYTYTWDLNNDGTFGDATVHNPTYTFPTTGAHTVSVRITDSGGGTTSDPSHTATVTRTINVVAASSTAPPPPPPPCKSNLHFELSEFTTTGCFAHISTSPDRWTTTSAVKLNGILLPDFGQTFTITGPTAADPGGHFTAPSSTVQLGGFTAFRGNIDWSLPAGGQGQEKALPGGSFSVASGSSLLGLNVGGSIALELGQDANGTFYADLPLSVQLPAGFSAGPDPSFGSVSGAASLRVDDTGIHYNGLRLEAKNVWLGKLKVDSVCFSYIPSGGLSTAPCDKPSFNGDPGLVAAPGSDDPFIQCGSDSTANRWDASAEVELPTGLQLGAFGGLANGQLASLGGSIGNLGRRVPLVDGIYLDHVSFGLCLTPPPLTIKAEIGANFLGASNLVNIDGSFTYVDGSPWSLTLGGSVSVGEQPNALPIGSGTLGINENGYIDFGLKAGVDVLNGFASLSAEVHGWIDAHSQQFLVAGDGQACLNGLGLGCLTAEGELSSKGVAGCVTIGSTLPSYDLEIPLDGSAWHLDTTTYPLTAGFGYDWGASSAQVLGGSCDFSPYQPTNPTTDLAGAAAAGIPVRIAGDTSAVALRIHGTHGAPKVVLHGPHGATITSPASGRGKLSKGHYLLAVNKADGTTDVMLVRPAAGTWTVSAAPGSGSSPRKIDRATLQVPPTLAARVLGKGGGRTVRVAYAVPVGATVRLLEHGKGVYHTIAARLHGRRCPGLPAHRPGTNEKILCANIRFRPAAGPGGTRHVQAVVTRGAIPLLQKNIASFRVPRLTLPARVGALRAQRGRGNLLIAFLPSREASRYSVSAKLSDGRELAFDLKGSCRALRIANVPATVAAKVKIAGVRFDLAMGRSRAISLKANARSTGSKSKKLRLSKACT